MAAQRPETTAPARKVKLGPAPRLGRTQQVSYRSALVPVHSAISLVSRWHHSAITALSQRDLALLGVGVGLDVLRGAARPAQGAPHRALDRRGVRRLGGRAPRLGGRDTSAWLG